MDYLAARCERGKPGAWLRTSLFVGLALVVQLAEAQAGAGAAKSNNKSTGSVTAARIQGTWVIESDLGIETLGIGTLDGRNHFFMATDGNLPPSMTSGEWRLDGRRVEMRIERVTFPGHDASFSGSDRPLVPLEVVELTDATLVVVDIDGDTLRFARKAGNGGGGRATASAKASPEQEIPALLEQLTSRDMVTALLAQERLIAIGKPALPALGALCQRLEAAQHQLSRRDAALAATTSHPQWDVYYQGRPVGVSRDLEEAMRAKLLCREAVKRVGAGEG